MLSMIGVIYSSFKILKKSSSPKERYRRLLKNTLWQAAENPKTYFEHLTPTTGRRIVILSNGKHRIDNFSVDVRKVRYDRKLGRLYFTLIRTYANAVSTQVAYFPKAGENSLGSVYYASPEKTFGGYFKEKTGKERRKVANIPLTGGTLT